MLCKELFNFQDKLYFIERKFNESRIKPESIEDLKKYWGCDNVVRQMNRQTNENYLLFLKEIPEAEILPD
jgi:hypothetical protein